MTIRAVIVAVLAAIFIATAGYFNEQVPRLSHFVGNHFPLIVFGPLILLAIVGSALVRLFKGRMRIRPAEVAVVVALALVACNIPGSGMMRFFTRLVVMPVKFSGESPGWHLEGKNILDYAPKCLLVNDGRYDRATLLGFEVGWGKKGQPISPAKVPWQMWYKPLSVWLPLITLVAVGSICMGLMVHRTWSQRERLPYPIARFAGALLEDNGRGGIGPILRSRSCWIGLALILGLHLINGLNAWAPVLLGTDSFIEIPTVFNFQALAQKYPALTMGRWAPSIVRLWPTAIAFACFIASDVSLAIGISPLALSLMTYVIAEAGGNITHSSVDGGYVFWQNAGSYLAMAIMVVYLGRRVYGQMFRGALLGRGREVRPYEIWACRIFLCCLVGIFAIVVSIGLEWTLALILVPMIMATYLVMARMNVESGLILVDSTWLPTALFLGLFGAKALGMGAFAILILLGVQFMIDTRECLMPFLMNALRICDFHKIRPGRIAGTGAVVFIVAMLVAVPFGLWVDYNYGVRGTEGHATYGAPRKGFDRMVGYHARLNANNELEASQRMSPLERLANMRPDPLCLWWIGFGAAAVLVFYALRLRFTWWPIHPILFLFWGTWAMNEYAWSFFIGWMIKRGLTRFGVREIKLRTFMTGVIAGDLVGGICWMIVGAIYHAATALPPPRYFVLPPAW